MTYMKNTEIARTFKKRLVKAFYELALNRHTDPYAALNDPGAMRGLLLNYCEKVIDLETKVEQRDKMIAVTAPKAAALDLITISEGSMCISQASKVLGFQRIKDCFAWLHSIHWIFRQGGDWKAHQDKVRDGFMEVKTFTHTSSSDGRPMQSEQALVTAKGLAKLAILIKKQPQQLTLVQGGVQ